MTTTERITRDLIADIHADNAEAKLLSRRGPCGLLSAEYARLHSVINDELDLIERWAEPSLMR